MINEYIDEVTAEQIVKIDETTVNQVQNRIKLGQSEGMTITEIAGTIDDLYLEQIIPNRSTTIARTETISSSNYGSLAGAEQATEDFDIKIKKIWIRTFDKRVRDTHIHAGQHKAIKLKEKFRVGRSLLRFPGDFAGGSKETIRCRCALGYESDD